MPNHDNANRGQKPKAENANKDLLWIAGILISVLIGLVVAWMGSHGSNQVAGIPVFAILVVWAFVINWIAFVPAFLTNSEKFFDLIGATTYITTVIAALALSRELDERAWLVAGMVTVWAARLGVFLFRRIHKAGRDGRFDTMKYDFWQFLMTWTIQGLWVSLTASAALAAITAAERVEFGVVGTIGLLVWLVGFLIEVVADWQKTKFKADSANSGRFITTGLWSWSRHPNYFGEILLWTGVTIMSLPLLGGWRWCVLISPIFVFVLLTKISGIPILRRRADERWGNDCEYLAYVKRTSELIPLPPKH